MKKHGLFMLCAVLLAGVFTRLVFSQAGAPLPDLGPAPELHHSVWLNSDRALRLQDLRGQVVLLDMWTFG